MGVEVYSPGDWSSMHLCTLRKSSSHALQVAAKSTTAYLIKGTLSPASPLAASSVALWKSVKMTGTVGLKFLGFSFRDIQLPHTTVSFSQSDEVTTVDESWSESITSAS